jgi:integrase
LQPESSTTRRVKVGPNVYRRGARFYFIGNINGKQVCQALQARNKTEAIAARDALKTKLNQGGVAAVGDRTLTFDALAAKFIEHESGPSGKLSKRTCDLRETLLRKHVSPALGKLKAVEITTPHVQALSDALTKKGLSGSSVRGIITSVSCVMGYGARYGHVQGNPCREVALPSGSRQTEPRYLEHEDVTKLLAALGPEFKPVAACCYFAALRASEALALRWRDVDFDAGLIHVRAGKTKASVNSVPIPLPLLALLKAHRQAQGAIGLRRLDPDALVFQTATGRPQGRRNALRAVNVASKYVGLWSEEDSREPVGLHDLRHSAASYYFAQGRKTREVSRLLRHANPVVTQVVYGGLAPKEEDEILESARLAFGGAS